MTTVQTNQSAYAAGSTGSRTTRILGLAALAGMILLAFMAFVVTEPDDVQGDVVRLIYVHVPIAMLTYVPLIITGIGSFMWLRKRSQWWDVAAHAGAEVGTVLAALTLVTGSIWGRPTWGTYWEWGDVRIVTSLILCLIFLGYLALRATGGPAETVATRAAVVGLVGVINIPIVNRSVEWWTNRTLHQSSTIAEGRIQDYSAFTLFLGVIVFALVVAWLMIHRFRVGWLERQRDNLGLDEALVARRAEAEATRGDGSVQS